MIWCFYCIKATQQDNSERTGFTTLIVTVLDANDNRPVIKKNLYEINIAEHTINGTVIGKLEAFDNDSVGKCNFFL